VALVLIALTAAIGDAPLPPAVASPPPPGLRLLEATPSGLVLEWVAPPIEVRPLGDGTVEVTARGCGQTDRPGAPSLPFTSTLVALPPGAPPHLEVLSVEEALLPLPAPLATAPSPEGALRDRWGHPLGGAFAPATREPPRPIPTAVTLKEAGIVRGVRLARLTLYPALPDGGRLRLVRRAEIEIAWPAGQAGSLSHNADPLLQQVRRAVLNPWDVTPSPPSPAPSPLRATDGLSPTAFVEVDLPGLYRVAYEDLDGLGFASADPHNLRLFQGDEEVACQWEGDDDDAFEPGEALLFYAEPRFSRWTEVDTYRLVADAVPGQRMAARNADPAGLPEGVPWTDRAFEENHIYTPDCFCGPLPPGHDGDRWAWEELRRPDRASASFPFQTPAVEGTRPATLTLWLIGYTAVAAEPDHRVDVALNGTALGRVEWDGKAAFTATLAIPAGLLREDGNALSLTLPGIPGVAVEGMWLDGFAVHYGRGGEPAGRSARFGATPVIPEASSPPTLPHRLYLPLALRRSSPSGGARAYTVVLAAPGPYRAYDITDPLHPRRLTGFEVSGNAVTVGDPPGGGPRRYLVTAESGIRRPRRVRATHDPFGLDGPGGEPAGADLLIITHPAFADGLSPLVDLRRSQGLTVTVVNVLGVYDTWGDGRPDPEAIRSFIAHAYAAWAPRPTYVLLVGDGSFDPRRYRSGSPPTFIPPYLADVDPWAGETAADNRYACVDGDDHLPDLLLGRLPVGSVGETEVVVGKVVAYETAPFPGGWNADVLLVADDADGAGDFAASSEANGAVHVTAPFTVTRRYCSGTSPFFSDCPAAEAQALHDALLADWNQGALLVQFTGHSSWQQWAAERFFHLDDLAGLHNGRRLPVVVEMTCFTGAFHRPEPTLDEDLVVLSGGGAVASWGPTGLGVGTGHAHLSDGFFRATFADGVETVGEAALAGKLDLAASGHNLDLLDTFVLLGDPALRLNRAIIPWAEQVFLPLVRR